MVIYGKISRGSRMDQIYLQKIRPPGFPAGATVEIKPTKKERFPLYSHKVGKLEPVKTMIKDEIFDYFSEADNVLITGSFLEEGLQFHDVDIVLLGNLPVQKHWREHFRQTLGINADITSLDRKSLLKGLRQDPLFQMMLSRYLAKKREILKYSNEVDYKLLDLHLLQSKALLDNFDLLTGREKYHLLRNVIAIRLFLRNKMLSSELVNKEIENAFGKVELIRQNLIQKGPFLKKFKKIYNSTFNEVMAHST